MKLLHGKGNVIVVRGVKGSAPDADMYKPRRNRLLEKYPDIKVVATVYGQATASVTQSAIANVLPSLPHVDAVLAQGGSDDYRHRPGLHAVRRRIHQRHAGHRGRRQHRLREVVGQQHKKNGYQTVSMNTTPGIGGAALWLGVSLLEGAKAPKLMIMPVARVDAGNLDGLRGSPRGPDHQPHLFAGLGEAEPAVEMSQPGLRQSACTGQAPGTDACRPSAGRPLADGMGVTTAAAGSGGIEIRAPTSNSRGRQGLRAIPSPTQTSTSRSPPPTSSGWSAAMAPASRR